jgi:hypothetical protein
MSATQDTTPRRTRNRVRHPRLTIGEHVRFTEGSVKGTGVVDAATADFSIVWLWTDGGNGRRMFLQRLGTIIESTADPDGEQGSA